MKTSINDFKNRTILVPMMIEPHFTLIRQILKKYGIQIEILRNCSDEVVKNGLSYVHNDMCYPAILVIGQMIEALQSGRYDLDTVALLLPQTGGGCRASNYIYLLRKALKKANLEKVPVLSLNACRLDANTLTLPISVILECIYTVLYGDFILCLYNQSRSHELYSGDSDIALHKAISFLSESKILKQYQKKLKKILSIFSNVEMDSIVKPRVGIVGEIYLKYSPLGNNNLEQYLIDKGAEPMVSGLCDFLLYCLKNNLEDHCLYDRHVPHPFAIQSAISFLVHKQKQMKQLIVDEGSFIPPHSFDELCGATKGIIGMGTKMGEGWLLSAEISAHLSHGVNNVICAQPFGCLPNHIVAKGVMANIRQRYPQSNVIAIDYDAGACRANQENRINLMLMNANKKSPFMPTMVHN